MAADSIPMTKAGADAIKREIKRLKSVERPKNVHDIGVAREHGSGRIAARICDQPGPLAHFRQLWQAVNCL